MKIVIQKQIGKANLTFNVEQEKPIDALVLASSFTTMPDKCGKCGGQDVELVSNKADKFTYVKMACQNAKCRATSTMGTYQDGSGFFWKAFEIFQREDSSAAPATPPSPATPSSDDDLPF